MFGETVATTLTGSSPSSGSHHHGHASSTYGSASVASHASSSTRYAPATADYDSSTSSGARSSQARPSSAHAHAGIVTIVDYTEVKHKTVGALFIGILPRYHYVVTIASLPLRRYYCIIASLHPLAQNHIFINY